MLDKNLKFTIGLSLLEGVGPVSAKNLVAYCGSAEAVFKEKKSRLLKIPGIGAYTASKIHAEILELAEQELEFIVTNNISCHSFWDDSYPQRLKYCDDGPLVLYSKGNCNFNKSYAVAVVGTRLPTDYGKSCCEKFIADLKQLDIVVVSGLAYGIDVCAHKKCLQENIQTVGVLAHGLDRVVYPSQHQSTANKMLEHGGLLTEFVSGTNPDRENFPKRNRIVAGMCDAIVVVETSVKGGSMITAILGNGYNRDVFAFPGRSGDEKSAGCNGLIRMNKAALIDSAADFLHFMGWENEVATKNKKTETQIPLFVDLDEDEKIIVNFLKEKGNSAMDLIAYELEIPISKLASQLLNLEFKNVVKNFPGKVFGLYS